MKWFRSLGAVTAVVATVACSDLGPGTNPVAVGEPISPPALSATASSLNGQHGVVIDNASISNIDNYIQHAVALGVGWVRFTFRWHELQPDSLGPSFSPKLDTLKANVEAARLNGLQVFVTLEGAPGWTRRCDQPDSDYYTMDRDKCTWDMTHAPDSKMYTWWQAYIDALVGTHFRSYPYDVAHWGIWNEPNDRAFFNVAPGRDAVEDYKTLLLYGAGEIRKYGALVVAPDLGQYGTETDQYAYLRSVLETHHGSVDIVSVHQYNRADGTESSLTQFKTLTDAYGKRLWLTEAGNNDGFVSDQDQQTHHLAGQMDVMQAVGWDKTFYFRLQGPVNNTHSNTHLVDSLTLGIAAPDPYKCFQWWTGGRVGPAPVATCSRHSLF